MKISLNFQLKNLSGKEFDKLNEKNELIEMHHAAKCLANVLWNAGGNNLKFALWSQDLYKTGIIEIDSNDIDLLIAWLEIYGNDPQKPYIQWFSQVGIRSQVIESIKKQKEKLSK